VSRVVVAWYSLSGYTESLAGATAEALAGHDAQWLEIVPARAYSNFSAGVRGVTEAMGGKIVELASAVPEAGSLDGLVVFSPTWGWMSSPPARSFVAGPPEGGGRPCVVGVTHAGGPIGSFDRLAGFARGRGYEVVEVLSVLCYSREQMQEAAARGAAALSAALAAPG
jgi:hypothetical protein